GLVRDLRQRLDVDDVDERVAERLGVEELGIFLDRLAKVLGIVGRDEGRLDAELPQVDVQQRVRAAVERRRRDDVVARAAEGQERGRLGRLSGGGGERRAPA